MNNVGDLMMKKNNEMRIKTTLNALKNFMLLRDLTS